MKNFYNNYLNLRENIKNNKNTTIIVIISCYLSVILFNLLPMFSDFKESINYSLLLFNGIAFLYWLCVISFILFLFFKLNKKMFLKHSEVILFITSFLFLLFWIPFGIDVTDEGKQMSISWFMFHGDVPHYYNAFKIGSWFINGLWLSIIGTPFLLWERLGGVIVMSLIALFSYKILKTYKNNVYTFFITFIILFLVICRNHPETKIDHSNLPTLLAIISIYLMILYVRPTMDFKGHYLFNILSALVMVFSIYTRFPHMLFLIFPAIFFIISIKAYGINKNKFLKAMFTYYLPILILGIIGIVFLSITGRLSDGYLVKVTKRFLDFFLSLRNAGKITFEIFLDNQELKKVSYLFFLLKRYAIDFVHITVLAFIFLIGLFAGKKTFKFFKNSRFHSDNTEIILFCILGIALFFAMLLKPWMWYKAIFGYLIAYLVIIRVKKIELKKELYFLYWGILLVIISFLGSNNSIRHSVPAGAVLIFIPIVGLMNKDKKILLSKFKLDFIYKFTVLFFIVILAISGYKKMFDNNKRDKPICKLNTMYSTPELFGIFSSKERVTAIDGIMDAAKKNINDSDTIICFNSIPMFYYLLNKDYFLADPWIIVTNFNSVKNSLENKANSNFYPDYIIFSKKSAKENNWPDTDIIIDKKDRNIYEYLIYYIKYNNYESIYENTTFILYKK